MPTRSGGHGTRRREPLRATPQGAGHRLRRMSNLNPRSARKPQRFSSGFAHSVDTPILPESYPRVSRGLAHGDRPFAVRRWANDKLAACPTFGRNAVWRLSRRLPAEDLACGRLRAKRPGVFETGNSWRSVPAYPACFAERPVTFRIALRAENSSQGASDGAGVSKCGRHRAKSHGAEKSARLVPVRKCPHSSSIPENGRSFKRKTAVIVL